MKRIDVSIAIVFRCGKVLICRRKADARLGGYWEFPGGKVEDGETVTAALARELSEEVAVVADPVIAMPVIEHDYPHAQVRLHPFVCVHQRGEAEPLGCQELKWIDPPALRDFQFPPANSELIERIISLLTDVSATSLARES